MKKYKQFIIGLIVGAILFSSIGVFAEGFTVLLNPYPIFFNGQRVEVEAYNVNGRTCIALGDVATLFGGTATLNETTEQIIIKSVDNIENPSNLLITQIKTDDITGKPIGAELIDYKGYKALKYNNDIYVNYYNIRNMFKIDSFYFDEVERKYVYTKGNIKVIVDVDDISNKVKFQNFTYYKTSLFNSIEGE